MSLLSEAISSKLFKLVHGNNLVYNACWEDPRLDKEALNLTPNDSVLVITSAGCNALSYALEGVRRVYAVDVNFRQNALLDLKIAGIKALDYETFFQLFGEGRLYGVEEIFRRKLRDLMPEPSQLYWDRYIARFFDSPNRTFYHCGTSGYFARQLTRYLARRKLQPLVDELFGAQDLPSQRVAWAKLSARFWTPTLKFFVGRDATMALLGVPRAQRKQIESTYGNLVSYVQNQLDELFNTVPIQDNYFWRAYAYGRYTKECCPEYLTKSGFDKLKSGAVDVVETHTNTVEGFLKDNPSLKISRFVLLDHMDWLSDKLFDSLVAEWRAVVESATADARVIWRSGGLDATSFLKRIVLKGLTVNGVARDYAFCDLVRLRTDEARELHKRCRVHTYGSFYIADLLLR